MSTYEHAESIVEKVMKIFSHSNGMIRPHTLLTGESGSGKTYLVQKYAKKHGISFLEINGAQLTNEGISGNSLSKALVPLKTYGSHLNIVFIDEIDKLFVTGEDIMVGREGKIGVQNELLKIMESSTTDVIGDYGKYQSVEVKNTLFMFAGAFNGEQTNSYDRLRDFGLRNEFLGRLGTLIHVPKPTLAQMRDALYQNEVFNTYCALFNTEAKVAGEYILSIVENYIANNNIGMRLNTTLAHMYFMNNGKITKEMADAVCLTKATVDIFLQEQKRQQALENGLQNKLSLSD